MLSPATRADRISSGLQHRWSNFYASGREILQYLKGVAAKYKLDRFLRYGHKLTAARWNEETAQWHLSFDLVDEQGNKHGEEEKVADVVIQGLGGLSRWDWPSIPGLDDYKVCSCDALLVEQLILTLCVSTGHQIPLGCVPRWPGG